MPHIPIFHKMTTQFVLGVQEILLLYTFLIIYPEIHQQFYN